jgi:hypothetical protein
LASSCLSEAWYWQLSATGHLPCGGHHFKVFACIHLSSVYKTPTRSMWPLTPFYRWRNRSKERWS